MNIAIASTGEKLENSVSEKFESCQYLQIVNTTDSSVKVIENKVNLSGISLAKKIIDEDCEGVITGKINEKEFDIIADACVTRYNGFGYSGKEALELMEKRKLKLIRNFQGTDYCEENHNA
jgi:predicted Fe-Mo cluster-binding NifX family protein